MKWMAILSICCTALTSAGWTHNFPIEEVMEMAEKDTKVRTDWIRDRKIERVREQEKQNTARLKEILSRYGLPSGYSEEDDELIEAITQLVLHSSDLEFQKHFLEKIPCAGDPWNNSIDELTDRVLLRQGLPQRYGTHVHHIGDNVVFYPIEDLEKANELRKESEELSLSRYLEITQQAYRSIDKNSDADLYKVIFNLSFGFLDKSQDYLYYASFEKNGLPPQEEEQFLAFEDASLATAYLLSKTSEIVQDVSYQKGDETVGQHLVVEITPKSIDDGTFFSSKELFVYLVPRNHFEILEKYAEIFDGRVFKCSEKIEPITEFQVDSPLAAFIMGGSKIQISNGMGLSLYEFKDEELRHKILTTLLFDITLENEAFD